MTPDISSQAPAAAPKGVKVKLQIAHQVPGRIRLKMPSAKGDPAALEQVKQAFSVLPGIERIDVNPDTGSIVLKYDADRHNDFHADFHRHASQNPALHRPPSNEIDSLAKTIEQEAEFLAEHSETARAIVNFCKRADREIKSATGNVLDFKMMLVIGLIGFTVFEIGASAATPVWVTLVLFGMNHFIEMQAAQASERAQAQPEPA